MRSGARIPTAVNRGMAMSPVYFIPRRMSSCRAAVRWVAASSEAAGREAMTAAARADARVQVDRRAMVERAAAEVKGTVEHLEKSSPTTERAGG